MLDFGLRQRVIRCSTMRHTVYFGVQTCDRCVIEHIGILPSP